MFVFDHVGVTTTEPQAGENWVEQSRVWVTNPRNHPEHVEFLRYAQGTTVPEIVRANPHVAYRVEALALGIPNMELGALGTRTPTRLRGNGGEIRRQDHPSRLPRDAGRPQY